ncbi:hypothetical protein QTO17_41490, partial [Vibrio owensii]
TLMMSNGGDAEGAFMYGVDRAYMTIFGVVLYTLVGTFLWPTKTEQNLRQLIEQLNQAQQALFAAILQNFEQRHAQHQGLVPASGTQDGEEDEEPKPTIDELLDKVFAGQIALEQRFATVSV